MTPRPAADPAPAGNPREPLVEFGDLAGEGLAGIVGIAGDAHEAVVRVVEAALPTSARPIATASRVFAGGVYSVVGLAHRHLPPAVAGAVARSRAEPVDVAGSRLGRAAIPVVNGLWGDRVARNQPGLAVPMAVRVAGADLPQTREAVAAAFPAARGHLVVFVPGLVETEQAWQPRVADAQRPASFGDRLAEELPVTSVFVRYNTGAHVSDNGDALAALLDALVGVWPVAVDRVSLVGHSMGGLVAVSACAAGSRDEQAWAGLVDTVVTLGTPHLGAALEKGVHALDWTLRRSALSAPYARLLGARSTGIKDLRHGAVHSDDWPDDDALAPDRLPSSQLQPGVRYCLLAGAITRDPEHPAGRLIGDGLVRVGSGIGQGSLRRFTVGPQDAATLGGLDHLAMLTHPDVYGYVRRWVDPSDEGATVG